jgi:hypothetical protein
LNEKVVTRKQTPCHENNYKLDQALSYKDVVFTATVFVGVRRHGAPSALQMIVLELDSGVAEQRRGSEMR